jgi:hypothetical protein
MSRRTESHVTEWASLLGERVAEEAVETGRRDRWGEFPEGSASR